MTALSYCYFFIIHLREVVVFILTPFDDCLLLPIAALGTYLLT